MKTNVTDDQLAAFSRRTNELYRRMTEGTLPAERVLTGLQALIEGGSSCKKIIDLDEDPLIPSTWHLVDHECGGLFEFGLAKIRLASPGELGLQGRVKVDQLHEAVKGKGAFNANLLDWFLRKPNLRFIPEEWKEKSIYFFGTIYRSPSRTKLVRIMDVERAWGCNFWRCNYDSFGREVGEQAVVAMLAS